MASNVSVVALLDEPRRVFSIDTERLLTFTHRPLKWLRYVSYCIIGLEGQLYETEDSEEVVDYEATDGLLDKYYFKPQGSLSSLAELLVDPSAIQLCCPDVDSISKPCEHDLGPLLERDGENCIFTGSAVLAGIHLIPYAKGDKYIHALTSARASAKYAEGDPRRLSDRIDTIDDVRNRIMVSKNIHCHLYGASADIPCTSAILLTPNFAMAPADVPRAPGAEPPVPAPAPAARLTLQFLHTTRRVPFVDGTHNGDAHCAHAPSSLALDYMYGATVLSIMGDPAFITFARAGHPLPALAAENAARLERERVARAEAQEGQPEAPRDWNTRVEDALAGLWFLASIPARAEAEAEAEEKKADVGAWARQCAEAGEAGDEGVGGADE